MSYLTWFFTIYFVTCILLVANSQSYCKNDGGCDPKWYSQTRCVNNECIACSKSDYRIKSSKCYEIRDTCQVLRHCKLRYGQSYSCVRGQCQCLKGYEFNENWGCRDKSYYCKDINECGDKQYCINEECVCKRGWRRDHSLCHFIPDYCGMFNPCERGRTCVNDQCQCLKAYKQENGSCGYIPVIGYCDVDQNCDPMASCVKNRCQCSKVYELINERCERKNGTCYQDEDCSSQHCDHSANLCECKYGYYMDNYECYITSLLIFKICVAVIVPLLAIALYAYYCYKERKSKRRNHASSHDGIVSVDMLPSSTVPLQTTTSLFEPQSAIHPSAPPADFNEFEDPPPYDSVVNVKQ